MTPDEHFAYVAMDSAAEQNDGDILVWNAAAQKWQPQAPSGD